MKNLIFSLFIFLSFTACYSTLPVILGATLLNKALFPDKFKKMWIEGVWDHQENDSIQFIMVWERETELKFRGQIKTVKGGKKKVIQDMFIINDKEFYSYIESKPENDFRYKITKVNNHGFNCKPSYKKDPSVLYQKNENEQLVYQIHHQNGDIKRLAFNKRK